MIGGVSSLSVSGFQKFHQCLEFVFYAVKIIFGNFSIFFIFYLVLFLFVFVFAIFFSYIFASVLTFGWLRILATGWGCSRRLIPCRRRP